MLKLSNDRKVSPLSTWTKGKKGRLEAKPKVSNSFGLPAGDSCPGKTEWCGFCYADKLQKMWSNVDKLMWHNMDLLTECGSNVAKMVDLLDAAVGSVNWRGEDPVFRWHWNGDIFSKPYAAAVAETCRRNPDVQFWLYTRSFDFIDPLMDVPNLTVYLSVDQFNIIEAKELYTKFPSLLIAACADTWTEAEGLMREVIGRNAPKCPELTGKIPLVTEDGVGACVECGMCIYGRNHVRFASKN